MPMQYITCLSSLKYVGFIIHYNTMCVSIDFSCNKWQEIDKIWKIYSPCRILAPHNTVCIQLWFHWNMWDSLFILTLHVPILNLLKKIIRDGQIMNNVGVLQDSITPQYCITTVHKHCKLIKACGIDYSFWYYLGNYKILLLKWQEMDKIWKC